MYRPAGALLVSMLIMATASPAIALDVRAATLYLFNEDAAAKESGTVSSGMWSLGHNRARVGVTDNDSTRLTGSYRSSGSDVVDAELEIGDVKATAKSEITWTAGGTPGTCPGSLACYALKVTASSSGGLLTFSRPSGGVAQGADPQVVESPGLFAQTVSLDAGSEIFVSRPPIDTAESTFVLTAPNLDQPLATIDLQAIAGGLQAIVSFAENPHLQFFFADTTSPITAMQVRSLLEGSALGSSVGLSGTLPLFSYVYDLTGQALPADAAFASGIVNTVSAVAAPEPATILLTSVGLVCIWALRRRQSQLNGTTT